MDVPILYSELPDPYQCTLKIQTSKLGVSLLTTAIQPLLEGVDPLLQFIQVEEVPLVKRGTAGTLVNQPGIFTRQFQDNVIEPDSRGIYDANYSSDSSICTSDISNALQRYSVNQNCLNQCDNSSALHSCRVPPLNGNYLCAQHSNFGHGFKSNQNNGVSVVDKKGCEALSTPSIAIVLFFRDKGLMSAEKMSKHLQLSQWQFQHKIELCNSRGNSVMKSVGKQEYYRLDTKEELPLWSVCPVHFGNEHLRFMIFTTDICPMVDFYCLVTGQCPVVKRPNFCLFQMYTQPGLDIQLAIKQSTSFDPHPIPGTSLQFKVAHMEALLSVLGYRLHHVGGDIWKTRDPDGNSIILKEIKPSCTEVNWLDHKEANLQLQFPTNHMACNKMIESDLQSLDSGRYSLGSCHIPCRQESFVVSTDGDTDTVLGATLGATGDILYTSV